MTEPTQADEALVQRLISIWEGDKPDRLARMEALTAAHVQAARAENTRLREALIAIRQNAIERASKWKGMSAIDIAREALGDLS